MSDTPEIIIRLAGPEDASTLSQLRYKYRAGQDPAIEDEADFLARCGAWMAARLAHGSHWRCSIITGEGYGSGSSYARECKLSPRGVSYQ